MQEHKITQISIEDLIPYANNARTHSDDQVTQIAASIKEFGFTNPVLIDKDNGIIAGHGRVMAAKKLGLSEVPAIMLDHLTDIQRKAYILADNRIALNSGWDNELLSLELHDLTELDFNLDLIGFSVDDLRIVMGYGADFEAGTQDEQGKLDEISPTICPSCGHEFHK
jgi:ParB-like chromosome segregation protein Spo0J